MGEVNDDHGQCIIVGEFLLNTLDRLREELIIKKEITTLYHGASRETQRRQVIEYLITLYFKQRLCKTCNCPIKQPNLVTCFDDSSVYYSQEGNPDDVNRKIVSQLEQNEGTIPEKDADGGRHESTVRPGELRIHQHQTKRLAQSKEIAIAKNTPVNINKEIQEHKVKIVVNDNCAGETANSASQEQNSNSCNKHKSSGLQYQRTPTKKQKLCSEEVANTLPSTSCDEGNKGINIELPLSSINMASCLVKFNDQIKYTQQQLVNDEKLRQSPRVNLVKLPTDLWSEISLRNIVDESIMSNTAYVINDKSIGIQDMTYMDRSRTGDKINRHETCIDDDKTVHKPEIMEDKHYAGSKIQHYPGSNIHKSVNRIDLHNDTPLSVSKNKPGSCSDELLTDIISEVESSNEAGSIGENILCITSDSNNKSGKHKVGKRVRIKSGKPGKQRERKFVDKHEEPDISHYSQTSSRTTAKVSQESTSLKIRLRKEDGGEYSQDEIITRFNSPVVENSLKMVEEGVTSIPNMTHDNNRNADTPIGGNKTSDISYIKGLINRSDDMYHIDNVGNSVSSTSYNVSTDRKNTANIAADITNIDDRCNPVTSAISYVNDNSNPGILCIDDLNTVTTANIDDVVDNSDDEITHHNDDIDMNVPQTSDNKDTGIVQTTDNPPSTNNLIKPQKHNKLKGKKTKKNCISSVKHGGRFISPDVQEDDADNYRKVTEVTPEMNATDLYFKVRGQKKLHLMCRVCGYVAMDSSRMKVHLRTHTDLIPMETEGQYRCGYNNCSYHGNQMSVLRHIRQVHNKPFKCDECEKMFPYQSKLIEHMERAHGGQPLQVCSTCGLGFQSHQGLMLHQRVNHRTNIKYKCHLCDKSLPNKQRLQDHIHSIHDDQALHTCPHCQKQYRWSSNLFNHIRSAHEGHSHCCDICSAVFTSDWSLKQHVIYVHTGSLSVCIKCGTVFKWRSSLQRHIQKKRCREEDI